MFSKDDLALLSEKGISENSVAQQINYFKKGFPFLKLIKAASVDDGIIRMTEESVGRYSQYYLDHLAGNTIVKFVPASGAASRMFKDFFGLMNDPENAGDYSQAVNALEQISDFAFSHELSKSMEADGLDLTSCLQRKDYQTVLRYILTDQGLNYGFLPKGLLLFHSYPQGARVPMEEHLVEAAHYGKGSDNVARLHFTVSPQHRSYFKQRENQATPYYQRQFDALYEVTYSEQKPSTDTIAVDLENRPFRNEDGTLLFRPGGHGALLENLNDITADIIFIKNIDNVVPDHLKEETYRYKKALAGLLLTVRSEIFQLLRRLDEDPAPELLEEASQYLSGKLNVVPGDGQTVDLDYIRSKLHRPLRICGMVRNEGEPGGGPFWVRGADGAASLQIGETSQIDMTSESQKSIVQNATHFNPVDLVCSTRDYQGRNFDLLQYRDPETGFISQKSKDGRELKALELPGLWNGSMAHWNTLFVEVPAATFNPVKTVNDLLRKEHQPQEKT